jgi:hypothetical protein
MSNNLKFWNEGSKSDSRAVKKGGAGNGNSSINSYYMFEKATELYGSCGHGWGYDVIEERSDDGKPVLTPDGLMFEKNHTIRLRLWTETKENYLEHFGHTKQLYWSNKNKYWIYDDEAPKKSLTDAIKKCLSMVGIYADVFKGMMDDIEYMQEKQVSEDIEKSENKQEEIERQIAEMREYVAEIKEFMDASTNMATLNGLIRKSDSKLVTLGKIPALFNATESARAAIAKKYNDTKEKIGGEK